MNKVIIVQARMTSTRLPGKVLKSVLGKTLLEYQIKRLQRVRLADKLVIATTENASDDAVVSLCQRLGVAVFRGSEDNVLARFYGAASKFEADVVIRITADCPLIDPEVVNQVIAAYCNMQPSCDYVSNCLKRTYPRGLDTEVFAFRVLQEAFLEAQDPSEQEHVTPFIYRRPERYKICDVVLAADESNHRWTVDTPEDFNLIEKMITALYPDNPNFTMDDCLALLEAYPDWRAINSTIAQKMI